MADGYVEQGEFDRDEEYITTRITTDRRDGYPVEPFPQMTLDLSSQWSGHHREGTPDLYPAALRSEMDEVMELVYRDVNNGVYRAGFAGSQKAYDAAYRRLFARLDWLSDRLARRRFPLRRQHHRGRRPALHHARAVRPGLPRPLQVQPVKAQSGWLRPHDRDELGGRPFGDGTPPPPPAPDEVVTPEHTPYAA